MNPLALLVTAGLSLAAVIPSQDTPFVYPQSPAGKVAAALVAMLERDEAAAREFIATHRSAA